MPGKVVQTVHIFRETIFCHHFLVGVTACTKIRFLHPELLCAWIVYVMYAVASRADRYIRIRFLHQGIPMNTGLLDAKLLGMTGAPRFREQGTRLIRGLY